MDPTKNGALAQWAIVWLNERLQASMEVQEEVAEGGEEVSPKTVTHTCTWSCPHLEGETVASGSAFVASESRQQAMASLYRDLPADLDGLLSSLAAQDRRQQLVLAAQEAKLGKVNALHNAVVQKLGIHSSHAFGPPSRGEYH